MVRHTRVLVLAAALVLSAAATPAAAAAPDPAAPSATAGRSGLPPGQLAALRRDLGLDDTQLHHRLVVEAAAPFVERRLRAELGATYGGAWVARDGGSLVVGVTDEA